MGRKFILLYKRKKEQICRPIMKLAGYFGVSMGLILWSYIISGIVIIFTKNINHLINIAFTGAIISLLPCLLGMSHTFNLIKKCNLEKCVIDKFLSGLCKM